MGGGRRENGSSSTSVVRFEKSGDDGVTSFVSSVWFSVTFCVIFSSFVFVTFLSLLADYCLQVPTSRVCQFAFQNPFPKIRHNIRCATPWRPGLENFRLIVLWRQAYVVLAHMIVFVFNVGFVCILCQFFVWCFYYFIKLLSPCTVPSRCNPEMQILSLDCRLSD